MLKKIFNFFKKEIQLNREYYQSLKGASPNPKPVHSTYHPPVKKHVQELINEAKFHASEINNSTTVFNFTYSYQAFRKAVIELIYLNEQAGTFMYPPPRQELDQAESNMEATINDFISRAMGTVRSFGLDWANQAEILLDEIEGDDCLASLMTAGNKARISRLRERINATRTCASPSATPTSKQNTPSTPPVPPYDFTTAEGIKAIPSSCDLLRSAGGDPDSVVTALRRKSFEYEEAEKIELAVLCLKKVNEIRQSSLSGCRIDDYYQLVGLLARSGQVEVAKAEKAKIDKFFKGSYYKNDALIDIASKQVTRLLDEAKALGTDLVIMDSHGGTCPQCSKYQGRVFSISGQSKMFPKIPREFFLYGGIHEGCGHSFWPYVHGVNDPMLDYSLSFQTAIKPQYRTDIVSFSNRPFVDDRLPEDIEKAHIHEKKLAEERKKTEYYHAHFIEIEAQRGIDKRNYKWLQEHLPDICPKSYSGYKRMKNGNTKNFQKLAARAKELGRDI